MGYILFHVSLEPSEFPHLTLLISCLVKVKCSTCSSHFGGLSIIENTPILHAQDISLRFDTCSFTRNLKLSPQIKQTFGKLKNVIYDSMTCKWVTKTNGNIQGLKFRQKYKH